MDNETVGHLFVSYSHVDEPYMLIFRKHLTGMLLNKVQVWSDHDIAKGAQWESFLKGNLNQASSAVVLATPDYLISPWCRQELKQLAAARRADRLRNLFWVQLKPCGWQYTELAAFQSFAGSDELAITELPDETQRQRAMLRVCEQMASEITRSITEGDKQLAFVRRLLLQSEESHEITVHRIVDAGPFSIICQGLCGGMNVAIKVLRRSPLERIARDFLRIGKQRMQLREPSFIQMHSIFQVGGEEEPRNIIVSDYLSNSTTLSTVLKEEKPIRIDKAALLLRRMAEGLAALHKGAGPQKTSPEKAWEWTLGLLTPENIYYDQPAERFRVAPIGISSFLWHVLDYATYADWVDPRAGVYVAPEQVDNGRVHLTPKADQYALGRLAVELFEGLPFEKIIARKSPTAAARDFWNDPQSFIENPWRNDHRQLWNIIETLLKKNPADRYNSMDEVVRDFGALEGEDRALAKRVYFTPSDVKKDGTPQLKDHREFFEQFYQNFFRASPASKEKFASVNKKEQCDKLRMSIAAVLNFRQGNEPTSLDYILDKHRRKGITEDEFKQFRNSFLDTLDDFTNGDQEVRKAWDDLFAPVIDYMVRTCVEQLPATTPEHEGVATYGAKAPESAVDHQAVKKKTRSPTTV